MSRLLSYTPVCKACQTYAATFHALAGSDYCPDHQMASGPHLVDTHMLRRLWQCLTFGHDLQFYTHNINRSLLKALSGMFRQKLSSGTIGPHCHNLCLSGLTLNITQFLIRLTIGRMFVASMESVSYQCLASIRWKVEMGHRV